MMQAKGSKKELPTLVLLNGLSRTTQHWLGFETQVEKSFRVITTDLRGAGKAQKSGSWNMTVEDMAGDVMASLDALEIEKAHFLGVSLGGMVAMACGIHYAPRCQSLVLLNSSIGSSSLLNARISKRALFFIFRSMLTRPDLEKFNLQLADLVVSSNCKPENRRAIATELKVLMERDSPGILSICKQLLAAVRFKPGRQLAGLKLPTLVVQGSHDMFVPPLNSQFIVQAIPGARLVTVENGGHELTLDRGDDILRILLDWIVLNKESPYECAQ